MTTKRLFFVLLIITCCMLLVMFAIAPFNYPSADDYGFGLAGNRVWNETHSMWRVVQVAANNVGDLYMNWQGNFVAVFLMGLQPAVFGVWAYALVPLFTLVPLVAGLVFLGHTVFIRVLKCDKWCAGCVVCLLVILCTQMLPSAVQGFYWFNGAIFYTFFFALSLFFYGLLVRFAVTTLAWKRRLTLGIACLLALLIGGGNYPTALSCILFMAVFALALLIAGCKRWKMLMLPFLCVAISFGISVFAPGNAVRQDFFTRNTLLLTIVDCFVNAFRTAEQWFGWPLLACCGLMLPLMWRMTQTVRLAFRYPALVTLASICFYAAGFAPALYAMTMAGPGRMVNLYYFSYVILMAVNLFYWIGWLHRVLSAYAGVSGAISGFFKRYAGVGLLTVGVAFLWGSFSTGEYRQFTAYSAFRSLVGGEAQGYYAEMEARTALYKDPAIEDVVVQPLLHKPYTIFLDDITTDPEYFANSNLAVYYGKNSIRLADLEEAEGG